MPDDQNLPLEKDGLPCVVTSESNRNERNLKREENQNLMAFFFIDDPRDKNLSHTIEFLVGSPRFFRGNNLSVPRTEPGNVIIERKFQHRDMKHSIKTTPALLEIPILDKNKKTVKDKEGKVITEEAYFYPGTNVELLEDIIIRLGTQGQGEFRTDDNGVTVFGVYFTINEIRTEHRLRGKTRSADEILHTINIGTKCNQDIFISHQDGSITKISSPIFKSFIHRGQKDSPSEEEDYRCYIELHPLVIPCVQSQSYRKFNYIQNHDYSNHIAQWLHKRMSHFYVQAGVDVSPYTILLSTIISLYGWKWYSQRSGNHREVTVALNEMVKKGDLSSWDYELQRDPNDLRKTYDYKYTLIASIRFANEMKKFNGEFNQRNPDKIREIPVHLIKAGSKSNGKSSK